MQSPRPGSTPEILSLQELIRVCKQNWLVIVTVFFLFLGVAIFYTGLIAEKWYRSATIIRVERPEGEVSLFGVQGIDRVDQTFLNNQFETIQSRRILIPVIRELNLEEAIPNMLGHQSEWDENSTYEYLRYKMVKLEARPNSSVIDIVVWATRPDLSVSIANTIAKTYEQDRIEFATSGQTAGINKLKEELEEQAEVVSRHRDRVEELRQELGLAGVDMDLRSPELGVELLRRMERTLTSLRVEAIARKTRWEQFKAVPQVERINLVNSELIPDQNIQDLTQAYLAEQQNFARLKDRLGEKHPDYMAMISNLETLRTQLHQLLDGFGKSLEISWREAQARVDELELQLNIARSDQIDTATNKLRLFEDSVNKLREEETVLRSLRLAVRQREIDFQVPKRPIEILSESQPPEYAGRPNWYLNLGLAGFGGLIFGFAGAYILAFVDTSFRSIEELETAMGLPILGVVSRKLVSVTPENFNGLEAEPYRVIQTNLDFLNDENPPKVMTVQSAGPGEGKSTTLYNLAVCSALSEMRTLIIDTDLRRPTQHQFLNQDKSPGLVEHFLGQADLDKVICTTDIKGLDFLPSGQVGSQSLSILMGRKLQELIEKLGDRYDRILLDSPPIVGISDASVIARIADGIVLVVQHGRNPRAMTQRAQHIIQHVEGTIFGVVLNQIPPSGADDYSYYAYAYHHYSDSERKDKRKREKVTPPASEDTIDIKD